ncbi:hypothetical protein KDA_63150 [Dictyobacter alpinus]|uniref:Uncharacterized protein n=1 Tax=Dictyobacter alpinus TaxID=2014873 RepID=A0A402BHE4_9CHLR|nr:hypothetical protein [Dictyobacter alpinus]GCE30831.1 hypothetical protein KDA_63150 [Dictyobacter alpinus]
MFPAVSGSNLAGRKFTIPADLEKERNLLIVAFKERQQDDVDTWMPPVKHLAQKYSDLAYYELPTITNLNPLFRWWIDNGMRSGIPDRAARATTITLYLDKQAFKQALNLPDEERIYLFVVTAAGEILWRGEGPWSQDKAAELEALLLQTAPASKQGTAEK